MQNEIISLVGQRFSNLVVLSMIRENKVTKCLCLCDCGKEKLVRSICLRNGQTRSCGCRKLPKNEICVGQVFDKLTIINKTGKSWICQCECGEIFTLRRVSYLFSIVQTKSCGCSDKIHSSIFKKYPLCYSRYNDMVNRCTQPKNKSYCDYGGRGISAHKEWLIPKTGRRNFVEYLLSLYPNMEELFSQGYELDRDNNNGNYEPGNLRIVTKRDNLRNRRSAQFIIVKEYNDALPILDAVEKYSFHKPDRVRKWLEKGVPPDEALFTWSNPSKFTNIPLNLDVLRRQVPYVVRQYFEDNEIFPTSSICEVFVSLIDHLKAAGKTHIYLDSNFKLVDNILEFKKK